MEKLTEATQAVKEEAQRQVQRPETKGRDVKRVADPERSLKV